MLSMFNVAVSICMYLTATASVIAGFRIFQRWNRGDDVRTGGCIMADWFAGSTGRYPAYSAVHRERQLLAEY